MKTIRPSITAERVRVLSLSKVIPEKDIQYIIQTLEFYEEYLKNIANGLKEIHDDLDFSKKMLKDTIESLER